MTARARQRFLASILAIGPAAWAAPADDVFPSPPELEADVAFWVRIFAEVDSDSGLMHDNRHL
ncbi:MAG TPA: hypothetical protein VFY03_02565, partial [Woeseiaceae bacterium]|nr:hypothetical protein [Woeseiaceae bacterium]